MKKIITSLIIVLCCCSIFAEDIKDTWFETLADATEKNLPKGMTLRKDKTLRFLFIDYPLPIKSSSDFDVKAAKKDIVKELRGSEDAEFIKKAEVTIIYNFITTDYKIYSVVISRRDL